MAKSKKKLLDKIKPRDYWIYGIFDFEKKVLVYIDLDVENVELEFALQFYSEDRYDIVECKVTLI